MKHIKEYEDFVYEFRSTRLIRNTGSKFINKFKNNVPSIRDFNGISLVKNLIDNYETRNKITKVLLKTEDKDKIKDLKDDLNDNKDEHTKISDKIKTNTEKLSSSNKKVSDKDKDKITEMKKKIQKIQDEFKNIKSKNK